MRIRNENRNFESEKYTKPTAGFESNDFEEAENEINKENKKFSKQQTYNNCNSQSKRHSCFGQILY